MLVSDIYLTLISRLLQDKRDTESKSSVNLPYPGPFLPASLVRARLVVYRKRMRPAHELFARPGRSRCP